MGNRASASFVVSGILAAALAACGGVENRLPDGEPGDDAPPDAPPVGAVTVTTYNRCCDDPGGLTAGVDVFVIEPDGSLGDRKTTSGTGMVTLEGVPAGSSVTALYPQVGSSIDRVTVVAVEPGDNLVFGETVRDEIGVNGVMSVTVPEYPGAYYYALNSPCGGGSMYAPTTTGNLYFYADSGCDPDDIDIQVTVVSPSYFPMASAYLDNISFADGGNVAVSSWVTSPTLQLRATDVPSEVDYVELYVESAFSNGSTYYGGYRNGVYGSPTDGMFASSLTWVSGGPGSIGSLSMYRPGDVGEQEFYGRFTGTASYTASPTPLPWLGEAYVSAVGREVAFAKLGDEPYDAAVLQSYWYDNDPVFGKGGTNHSWVVIIPPGVTEFTWANAPAAIAGFLPTTFDNLSGNLMLVDFPNADGYDGLRALDETAITCPECALRTGVVESGLIGVAYGRGGKGFAARSRPARTR
jgi:hypothetical protein